LNGSIMEKSDSELVGINVNKPAIKTRHDELERLHNRSPYKSKCPECKKGVLLINREMTPPHRLLDFDRCVLCGQLFQYVDILTMRKKDFNE